jgi:N-acetylmuramoyl-L-alanine amidase
MLAVYRLYNPAGTRFEAAVVEGAEGQPIIDDPSALVAPILKPLRPEPVLQRLRQSPAPVRVGLIAGHRGFDSGTVCADGLTEVQINVSVTERVAERLAATGLAVDILDEFDPRLDGYFATALVSVHVDSCDFVNELATGYKIAGTSFLDSSDLSICLEEAYGEATGLTYHANSVTPEMTDYHAFREISPATPATIIEIGFLNLDREILTTGSEKVVDGLVGGIECYLEQAQ